VYETQIGNNKRNEMIEKLKAFWNKGKKQKTIIIVVAIVIIMCFCCIGITLLGNSLASSPTYQATQTASVSITQTFRAIPTNTQPPTNTLRPSDTPIPAATNTSTPIPPPTKDTRLGMTLAELIAHYNGLTDLQKADYIVTLPGRTVEWSGMVYEVHSDGEIVVEMPGMFIGMIYLKGVPLDIAKTINKDAYIKFTGTISQANEIIGILYIYLSDVKIIP
jgi:hypothetical protein